MVKAEVKKSMKINSSNANISWTSRVSSPSLKSRWRSRFLRLDRLRLWQPLFLVSLAFICENYLREKNWQPTNLNCCVCQPTYIVDQIFLGFDCSFLFCFWNQYIQTISKHNPNLPCLRCPSCGILIKKDLPIDAIDLRQTFLLYARQWLWRHKRTTTQYMNKREMFYVGYAEAEKHHVRRNTNYDYRQNFLLGCESALN